VPLPFNGVRAARLASGRVAEAAFCQAFRTLLSRRTDEQKSGEPWR
jgi:hypothetical protein